LKAPTPPTAVALRPTIAAWRSACAALALALLCASAPAAAEGTFCDGAWSWVEYQCAGVIDGWKNGTWDLYLTGRTWHNPHTYTQEKLDSFNDDAYGGGIGISKVNDRGDSFGWYALAFRDSHNKFTKMAGWEWMTYWPAKEGFAVGLGYTAFLGSRPDIYNGIPFPGILPLASAKMGGLEVMGTYIPKVNPNTTGNGNVAFIFGRFHF